MVHSDERKINPPDGDDDIKIIEENERPPEIKARSTPILPIISDNDIIILDDIPDTSSSVGDSEKYPDGLLSSEKIREHRQPSIPIGIKNVKNTENTNFLKPDPTGESESERKTVELKLPNNKIFKSKNKEATDENALKSLVSSNPIPQITQTVPYTDNKEEAQFSGAAIENYSDPIREAPLDNISSDFSSSKIIIKPVKSLNVETPVDQPEREIQPIKTLVSDISNAETIIKDSKSKSGQNSPEIKATDNKIPGITNKEIPADDSIKTPVTSDQIPQTANTAPFADNIEDTQISAAPIENYTEAISPQKIPESQLDTISSDFSSFDTIEKSVESPSAKTPIDPPEPEIQPIKPLISEIQNVNALDATLFSKLDANLGTEYSWKSDSAFDPKSESNQNSLEITPSDNKIPGLKNSEIQLEDILTKLVSSEQVHQKTPTTLYKDHKEDSPFSESAIENYLDSIATQTNLESHLDTVPSAFSNSEIIDRSTERLNTETPLDPQEQEIQPIKTVASDLPNDEAIGVASLSVRDTNSDTNNRKKSDPTFDSGSVMGEKQSISDISEHEKIGNRDSEEDMTSGSVLHSETKIFELPINSPLDPSQRTVTDPLNDTNPAVPQLDNPLKMVKSNISNPYQKTIEDKKSTEKKAKPDSSSACPNCGREVSPTAIKCIGCGRTLPRKEPPTKTEPIDTQPQEKTNIITQEAMNGDLNGWGIALVILGIIHIVFYQYLDAVWGIFIIGLGIAAFKYHHRNMYLILGGSLILVGVLNILTLTSGGNSPLLGKFSIIQIILGLYEMRKYWLVKKEVTGIEMSPHDKSIVKDETLQPSLIISQSGEREK